MRKASKKASETPEETINRQEQSKMDMVNLRASETPQQTGKRQIKSVKLATEPLKHHNKCCNENKVINAACQTSETGV